MSAEPPRHPNPGETAPTDAGGRLGATPKRLAPSASPRAALASPPTPIAAGNATLDAELDAWLEGTTDPTPRLIEGGRGYRILGSLGEGGMGEVLLAERADGAYEQRVAIKVLRAGRRGESALRRLRTERQILANLDHPAIARLLDGGTQADGTPFLVMEHVDGQEIDDYCRTHELSVRARLELFSQVLDAVSAAHRQLIVHRDIKPSNVLVDRQGRVKLLDFGIAKLLDPLERERAGAQTELAGGGPMTLRYAAPEQIRAAPVTTATDVWGLGVLLYELLTGSRPYAAVEGSIPLLAVAICDQDPERPSTVADLPTRGAPSLATRAAANPAAPATADLGADLAEIAAQSDQAVPEPSRRHGVRRRELAGDLDAIVLKALRKEPAQRYASVDLFAADVAAYLAGMPVAARRGSRLYRVGKYVRRHRLGIAAAVALVALLVVWAVSAQRQLVATRLERDKARQVTSLLVNLFDVVDSTKGDGKTITAAAVMDRAADRLDRELAEQPAVHAELAEALGQVYLQLGMVDRAASQVDRALELRRASGGSEANALALRGWIGSRNKDLAAAVADLEAALPAARRDRANRPRLPAEIQHQLALVRQRSGDLAAAETALRAALDELPATGEGVALLRSSILAHLVLCLQDRGQFAPASELLAAAQASAEQLAGNPPRGLEEVFNSLGIASGRMGEPARALALLERSIELYRLRFDGDHSQLAIGLNNLGLQYYNAGRYQQAITTLTEARDMVARVLGPDHPQMSWPLSNLGRALTDVGQLAAAEAALREGIRIFSAAYPNAAAYLAYDEANLGVALAEQQRFAEAREWFVRALEHFAAGGDKVAAHNTRFHWARMELAAGDRDRATELVEAALAELVAAVGSEHPRLGFGHLVRGEIRLAGGRTAEAAADAREAMRLLAAAGLADHDHHAQAEQVLGAALLVDGDHNAALPALERAAAALESRLGTDHPRALAAAAALGAARSAPTR